MASKTFYPTAWVRMHLLLDDFGQPDDEKLITLEYHPQELTVTRNHFQEADTIEGVIDFEDFPLDTRILRGVTVEAFLADGGPGQDLDFWLKQSRRTMREEYAVFVGVIDELRTGLGDEGRSVKFKGRDYTAYLLDVETDGLPVSFVREDGSKLTIVEVVEAILQDPKRPQTHAITVRDRDAVHEAMVAANLFPAIYKLRGDDTKTGKRRKKQGESVWDQLSELVHEAGFILYVELDEVVIREPTTIFVTEGLDPNRFTRFVLGDNLLQLNPSRRMGRQQGINVRCYSYLPDEKKTLRAVAPENALQAEKAEIAATPTMDDSARATTKKKRKTFRPYHFRGIKSQTQLQRIADQLYELVRHHELEGSFSTDDMVDIEGRSVLRLGYGDPIVFDVAESLRSLISLSRAEQVQRLLERGYPRETAEKVARALEAPKLPFYLSSVTHRFSAHDEEGYRLTAEVQSRRQVDVKEEVPVSELVPI